MATWGICSTVKAPLPQVLAFVAHHLSLGASQITLHFDDPADPAEPELARVPGVVTIRCRPMWWRMAPGTRPDGIEARQAINMKRAYRRTGLDWLAHIDVDEFLWPRGEIATLLEAVPQGVPLVRAEPWEALHEPGLPDDILTARLFRRALPGRDNTALRGRLFGPFAPLLPRGAMSHSVGKCFFRKGVAGLEPRLHGGVVAREPVRDVGFHPDIALLHFHAQDREDWLQRLAFRLQRGAYAFNPDLAVHLATCDAAGLAAFFDAVQVARPEAVAALRGSGALLEVDLGLRDKVMALRAALG